MPHLIVPRYLKQVILKTLVYLLSKLLLVAIKQELMKVKKCRERITQYNVL